MLSGEKDLLKDFLPSTEPLNPNCLPEIQIVRKKVVGYPKTVVVGWWLLPRQRTTKHGFRFSASPFFKRAKSATHHAVGRRCRAFFRERVPA
jgi:hypothetical protein